MASLGADGLAVQEALARELDLAQPEIAWHTERDRIAEAGCFLGLLTGVLYEICHDPAIGHRSFRDLLLAHPEVCEALGEDEIRELTDPENYLGLSEAMVDRVLAAA